MSAATLIGNLLGAVGLVLLMPVVLLAIGTPIVLGLRFLFWFAGIL